MELWSIGEMRNGAVRPLLHHSNTPVLHALFAGFPLASAASRQATEDPGTNGATSKTRCGTVNKDETNGIATGKSRPNDVENRDIASFMGESFV
jgi:hypothetical protein